MGLPIPLCGAGASVADSLDVASHLVLVLEPDGDLARRISSAIRSEDGFVPVVAGSREECEHLLGSTPHSFLAAAVDIDSLVAGPMVEELTRHCIPILVYGESFDESQRKHVVTLGIADQVIGPASVLPVEIAASLTRLVANREVAILVVDDSRSMRSALVRFLKNKCYRVREANNGREALDLLATDPDIRLVITDNEMPEMDGFTLVKEIRKLYSKDDLAVIGISARTNSALTVRFINNGANDFLNKPFVKEELYCRAEHNLEMLRRIRLIRELSYTDPLTKLSNRRFFFENCDEFVQRARDAGSMISLAMADVDHFKVVNDTYGHNGGDLVLKRIAALFADVDGADAIVARFGGEEFCLLLRHDPTADVFGCYDMMRRKVERESIELDGEAIGVTLSIGVCTETLPVEEMIKLADARLYAAKQAGRNRVVIA